MMSVHAARSSSWSIAIVVCVAAAMPVRAAENEPIKVAATVDEHIEAKLRSDQLPAAPLSTDVVFMRRAYLDLTGCIPTAEQADEFLRDDRRDKRRLLIDKLLASSRYGEHFGRVWRDWIAPAELPSEGNGGNQPIKATRKLGVWFAKQFNKNRPWNELVHDVLTVDGELSDHPQALFYSLVGTDTGIPQPAGATRAVGSLFLGIQLQCAECHDDPFRAWKQDDFWGAAAFFRNTEATFAGRYFASVTETFGRESSAKKKRTSKKTTRNDKSPNGFITIPAASFTNSGRVVPGRFPGGARLVAKKREPLRPVLAGWLTARDNPYFAQALVNRMWAYFFVRGFVHPVDDLREDNPASHPRALQLLTEEFRRSDFDVKHLIRCITNSAAYQRSSRKLAEKQEDARVTQAFGRRPLKLMSTDMLFESLKEAFVDPALDMRTVDPKLSSKFGESTPIGDAYQEFSRLFETNEDDATDFRHGIPQFLALMNHPRLQSGGKRVTALMTGKLTQQELIDRLYLATLSRRATAAEQEEAVSFVNDSQTPKAGYDGLLWMLVNRSEFLLIR